MRRARGVTSVTPGGVGGWVGGCWRGSRTAAVEAAACINDEPGVVLPNGKRLKQISKKHFALKSVSLLLSCLGAGRQETVDPRR